MSASALPLDKISAAPSSPSPVDSYRYRELMEQSLAAEIEAAEAEILRLHERQAVMKAVDSQDASVGTLASAGAGWTPPRGRSCPDGVSSSAAANDTFTKGVISATDAAASSPSSVMSPAPAPTSATPQLSRRASSTPTLDKIAEEEENDDDGLVVMDTAKPGAVLKPPATPTAVLKPVAAQAPAAPLRTPLIIKNTGAAVAMPGSEAAKAAAPTAVTAAEEAQTDGGSPPLTKGGGNGGGGWNPFGWLFELDKIATNVTTTSSPTKASSPPDKIKVRSSSAGSVDGRSSLSSSASSAPPRSPPHLRVEKVNRANRKPMDRSGAASQLAQQGLFGSSHRSSHREEQVSSRSSHRASARSTGASSTASYSSVGARNGLGGGGGSTGGGGGVPLRMKQLRKDKHKNSLFTPRDEELRQMKISKEQSAANRRASTQAAAQSQQQHTDKKEDNAATATTQATATATGSSPAKPRKEERIVAAEEKRDLKKLAIKDACDRMAAKGEFLTMSLSAGASVKAGPVIDGKGSLPPAAHTIPNSWDQPVRVASYELASALGLEESDVPEEVLLMAEVEPERVERFSSSLPIFMQAQQTGAGGGGFSPPNGPHLTGPPPPPPPPGGPLSDGSCSDRSDISGASSVRKGGGHGKGGKKGESKRQDGGGFNTLGALPESVEAAAALAAARIKRMHINYGGVVVIPQSALEGSKHLLRGGHSREVSPMGVRAGGGSGEEMAVEMEGEKEGMEAAVEVEKEAEVKEAAVAVEKEVVKEAKATAPAKKKKAANAPSASKPAGVGIWDPPALAPSTAPSSAGATKKKGANGPASAPASTPAAARGHPSQSR